MDRRHFLWGAAVAGLGLSSRSHAGEYCQPATPWQPGVCTAGVNLNTITYAAQSQSQWCWAAATEMIFSHYGYRVPQTTIVQAVYGRLVNLPAFNTATISRLLSGNWQDARGRRFSCRIRGLHDAFIGVSALSNYDIINALRAERPLYYCNQSHAMVLTAISYVPTPSGPHVVNLGLIDPWPGRGARGAEMGEMTPVGMGGRLTYLALPEIRSLG